MAYPLARPPALPARASGRWSMFDPVFVGIDEHARPVHLDLSDQIGIVLLGEPGSGKSVALSGIVAHAALSWRDCSLTLMDGAMVELGAWRDCADVFVGPDLDHAINVLEGQQQDITRRCELLLDTGRRKVVRGDPEGTHATFIDELAYYTATVGTKAQRDKFNATLRGNVAIGRKCGYRYVLATQRPSSDIVPASLRDLFGYRWAFRCATDDSSDVGLGKGTARSGYTAAKIPDESRGVGLLRAEGKRVPRLVKSANLTDTDIRRIAAYAAALRNGGLS